MKFILVIAWAIGSGQNVEIRSLPKAYDKQECALLAEVVISVGDGKVNARCVGVN